MSRNIHTVPTSQIGQLVGIQNVIKIPSPAAGAEWTVTLPGGYYYRILGGSALLTTSAVVANRLAGIQITDGANILGSSVNNNNVVASTATVISYVAGGSGGGVSGTKPSVNVSPPGFWLSAGFVVSSNTSNIDVGDQYSKVLLWFEQLDFGALGLPQLSHARTQAEAELTTAGTR